MSRERPSTDLHGVDMRLDPDGVVVAANESDILDEIHRMLHHDLRWRRRLCRLVTFGRHWWGDPVRVGVGPVNFDESDETLLGWLHQCRLCYDATEKS